MIPRWSLPQGASDCFRRRPFGQQLRDPPQGLARAPESPKLKAVAASEPSKSVPSPPLRASRTAVQGGTSERSL
eukprot:12130999-Alexandrium_andersonii.AAC.1